MNKYRLDNINLTDEMLLEELPNLLEKLIIYYVTTLLKKFNNC